MKSTLKLFLGILPFVLLSPQASFAAGFSTRVIKDQKVLNCSSKGWTVAIIDFAQGDDTVKFSGKNMIQEIVRAKPPGWTPDISIGESSTKRGPIVHDNSKLNGGKICASDGSVIGFGQSYYEIQLSLIHI